MLVGVVSDTHGYTDPRLLAAFASVEAIIHAGDVGSLEVLETLASLAPVYAVRGNNDRAPYGLALPERLDLDLAGLRIHVVHELPLAEPRVDTRAVVFGHSHRQLADWREGILYLNPGAAGRTGFHKLQTAALLRVEGGQAEVELLALGPRLALQRRQLTTRTA